MSYSAIEFTKDENIAVIRLNRPELVNSINAEMAGELLEAFDTVANDADLRAVLLTGAGNGFCAGQDLGEVKRLPVEEVPQLVSDAVRERYNKLVLALRELECPVVCYVNGVAAGAGANLALACDIVLASREAYFVQAFSSIGLIPDTGGTFFLPKLVGVGRAMALTMLADKLPAEEAQALGLVYRTYPEEEGREEALRLTHRLSQRPTRALALTKRAINLSLNAGLKEQLEHEAELQEIACRTKDFQEGVSAFLEKRQAKFVGK